MEGWVGVSVEGEGCAVVAAVGAITLATNARVGLGLGRLAHVRLGESGGKWDHRTRVLMPTETVPQVPFVFFFFTKNKIAWSD